MAKLNVSVTRKRSRKSKRNKGKGNPSQTALIYTGPIQTVDEVNERATIASVMMTTAFLSSSAGSVINTVFASSPTGCTDWGSFAASWHEYRVLGMRVEYFPNNRYSKSTTTCRPLIVCSDRSNGGTIASYSSAVGHESARKRSLEDPWVEEIKMEGAEDAVWTSTATSYSALWIKLYADGLSVSTEYGMYIQYIRVQFRGRL